MIKTDIDSYCKIDIPDIIQDITIKVEKSNKYSDKMQTLFGRKFKRTIKNVTPYNAVYCYFNFKNKTIEFFRDDNSCLFAELKKETLYDPNLMIKYLTEFLDRYISVTIDDDEIINSILSKEFGYKIFNCNYLLKHLISKKRLYFLNKKNETIFIFDLLDDIINVLRFYINYIDIKNDKDIYFLMVLYSIISITIGDYNFNLIHNIGDTFTDNIDISLEMSCLKNKNNLKKINKYNVYYDELVYFFKYYDNSNSYEKTKIDDSISLMMLYIEKGNN